MKLRVYGLKPKHGYKWICMFTLKYIYYLNRQILLFMQMEFNGNFFEYKRRFSSNRSENNKP